jgi:pimeloyl-ACP methyl ester carboxylesterase
LTGLALLIGIGLVVFLATLVLFVIRTLTRPPRRTYAWAVARGRVGDPSELDRPRPFRNWTFRSRGLELPVWEIEGDVPGGPTVICTHGWGDSRLGGLVRVDALAPAAGRIILWDLPGHGEAPGTCRLGTAEARDLLELIDHVAGSARRHDPPRANAAGDQPERCGHAEHAAAETKAAPDVPSDVRQGVEAPPPAPSVGDGGGGLVLYGWSLGAGVSIVAAARDGRVSGVIAEAPYRFPMTPARNVLRGRALPHRLNLAPAFWLLGLMLGAGPGWGRAHPAAAGPDGSRQGGGVGPVENRSHRGPPPSATGGEGAFDRAAHAARLRCPLLVLHGEFDEICPLEDARAIVEAVPEGVPAELAEIQGAGHNNLWTQEPFASRCAEVVWEFVVGRTPGRIPASARYEQRDTSLP